MNGKEFIRTILYILAAIASIATWIYSNHLTDKLKEQEKRNISLWAEAMREVTTVDVDGDISEIVFKIIQENKTIPAILEPVEGTLQSINVELDTSNMSVDEFLMAEIDKMKGFYEPITIDNYCNLYYRDSDLLLQLERYPIIQLVVTLIIIVLTIVSIRVSNKADQNKIMVGMSKETAHQLGTPITSLLAWIEMLKIDNYNPMLTAEAEKDVNRLVQVTNRFSKIGNNPEFTIENIAPILANSINYLKSRTSSNVIYTVDIPENINIAMPISVSLFEWVIENICKNAIDAMQGKGHIDIKLFDDDKNVYIDITDSGKGIAKRNFKSIFKPGFTTKKHGWGLGLSLAQRIICDYHKGKIFVKASEIGKGSTFEIILQKINKKIAVY
ncbi:MAG: HAMP domain-containing histidine kinase [Bacteroidales bacterium]|nr:HAMP domain-containing histidine kinase [Bacteroidales bacterium]